eukprot:2705145-Rhodomonas_salina.1
MPQNAGSRGLRRPKLEGRNDVSQASKRQCLIGQFRVFDRPGTVAPVFKAVGDAVAAAEASDAVQDLGLEQPEQKLFSWANRDAVAALLNLAVAEPEPEPEEVIDVS